MRSSRPRFGPELVAGASHYASDAHGPTFRPGGLENWVLNLTLSGAGRVNPGPDGFLAETGDVLLFPPRVRHDYAHAPGDGHWTHAWIYFNPGGRMASLVKWPVRGGGVLGFRLTDAGTRERVRRAMERCLELYQSPHPNRLAFCANALEEALLWCDTQNPFKSGHAGDERIDQAVAILMRGFAEAHTAESLARACHLSVSRFAHLFRSVTGTAPLRYLENLRVWKAQELLIGSGRPVKEIGREVGFSDPLYFSKVFRRHLGVGPRDYRRRSRGS